MGVRAVYRRWSRYFDHPDPRAGLACTVALVVVGNLPFYPAYVWWIAGDRAWATCLAWLSVPAFAAVPALARRSPALGKGALVAAGLANTAICDLALGRSTAIELYALPCLVLAALLFTGTGRAVAVLTTLGATGVLMWLATGRIGLAQVTPDQAGSLARLNALSVAGLMVVIAVSAWRRRVFGAAHRSPSPQPAPGSSEPT